MTSRPVKLAVVLLLGFVLVWQGVFALSTGSLASTLPSKRTCCCMGCDNEHCATPACCVKQDAPSAPVAPASLPSTSQNKTQALATVTVAVLTLPAPSSRELPARVTSFPPVTAIPLFERDCAWLI